MQLPRELRRTNPVRRARLEAELSQVTLAVRAGISLGTLRTAEQGIATPRTLHALANALRIPPERLGLRASPGSIGGA
jgi:transcriptional regulator with XRE-family HTH domain